MPGKNSAAKRHRQSEAKRVRNRAVKSRIHTEKRKFLEAIGAKDADTAKTHFSDVVKLIDSAAGKGVYSRNTADRKKSRMHKLLNSLASQ